MNTIKKVAFQKKKGGQRKDKSSIIRLCETFKKPPIIATRCTLKTNHLITILVERKSIFSSIVSVTWIYRIYCQISTPYFDFNYYYYFNLFVKRFSFWIFV